MNPSVVSLRFGSVPYASCAASSKLAPTPTKPSSTPIDDCAATIRVLAGDVRNLHKAFDETQRHILRIPDHLRPSNLGVEWRTYTEGFQAIIQASDSSATNLASTINVYLSFQGVGEEDTDDMIEELSALRKDLAKAPTDISALCGELKRRIEACLLRLTATVTSSLPAAKYSRSAGVEIATESATTNADDTSRRAWSRAMGGLTALQQLKDPKRSSHGQPQPVARRPSQGFSAVPDVVPTVQSSCALPQGSTATASMRSAATPDARTTSRSTMSAAPAVDEILVKSITDIISSLNKVTQQLRAFSEIAKHLDNEINEYQSAFQALKMYPTPDKRTALQNMHARVAASAGSWKVLGSVLMDEYALLQK